jgi:uncharacterized protein (TIGR00369 family)
MSQLTRDDIQAMLDGSPFIASLNLSMVELGSEAQSMQICMPFSTSIERKGGSGQVHGGAIAALIDTAGTFAIIASLGHGVPTIDIRIDYLRPAVNSGLIADAQVRRLGRTIGIVDVEVCNDEGKTIALGRGTFGASSK